MDKCGAEARGGRVTLPMCRRETPYVERFVRPVFTTDVDTDHGGYGRAHAPPYPVGEVSVTALLPDTVRGCDRDRRQSKETKIPRVQANCACLQGQTRKRGSTGKPYSLGLLAKMKENVRRRRSDSYGDF